jgi:diguanylate cyclase (GGDEF)-like protein
MQLYDKLTGLYNYDGFLTNVKYALEEGGRKEYVLIRFDIKNFKLINDNLGLDAGDRLLCRVADSLRKKALPESIECRIDGDRFAVFIPAEYKDEMVNMLLKTPLYADHNDNYPIYIYMGIYKITDKSVPVSVMSDRANIALSTIKSNRYMRVATYEESMYKAILRECELSNELEEALDHDDIVIYLQPQVTKDENVSGAEALVRWNHPEKGMLNPGEFIPVFEKNYKIVEVDKRVWELACRQIKQWNDEGLKNVYISINISPSDCECIDVYETITDLVDKYDISPEQLRIEITETTIMKDFERQIELIERFRLAGFYVEMDDFGSGYSSLGMLKDIRLDAVKLDMQFLSRGADEERCRKILKLTVSLIKELNMTAIVEGVENREEVAYLKQIGCDVFQGYYYSKPISVDEFEQYYIKNTNKIAAVS